MDDFFTHLKQYVSSSEIDQQNQQWKWILHDIVVVGVHVSFECNSYFSFASWKLREFLFISEIEFQLASKKFMAMRYALPAEGQSLVNKQ